MKKLFLCLMLASCTATGSWPTPDRVVDALEVARAELYGAADIFPDERELLETIGSSVAAIESVIMGVQVGEIDPDNAAAMIQAIVNAMDPVVNDLLVDANAEIRLIVVGTRAAVRTALALTGAGG